jgi:hypothetical protein
MIPSPITLIGLGITGIFFGGGIIPIRVIVPHHFFSDSDLRFIQRGNPYDSAKANPLGAQNQAFK